MTYSDSEHLSMRLKFAFIVPVMNTMCSSTKIRNLWFRFE